MQNKENKDESAERKKKQKAPTFLGANTGMITKLSLTLRLQKKASFFLFSIFFPNHQNRKS